MEVACCPLRCQAAGVHRRESGFNTSMRRLRARAPRGEGHTARFRETLRQEHTTLIASITLQGVMGASMTIEGATDAEVFEAYVEHYFLAPPRSPKGRWGGARRAWSAQDAEGEGAHRRERCRPFVPAVLFARPQSHRGGVLQDKEIVRKAQARTREALVEAIALAISALTLEDAWRDGLPTAVTTHRINTHEHRCQHATPFGLRSQHASAL